MSTDENPGTPPASPAATAAWSFDTLQVHAGQQPDPTTGARALPIYQTTSYAFRDTDHAAALFGLTELGNIYTRIMNPTQAVVEERIAALEGGLGALLVASGQSATTLAVLNVAQAGDHVVASPRLYGGTYNLFRHTLPKLGVTTTFVEDPDDPASWSAAVRPATKLFYAETISNPAGDVLDIAAVADAAHAAGVPLVVDNTVATPWLVRPIEHGADVVVHSATKFLGGHGTSIAGVVVDSGRFDWAASGRFPGLSTPDPSYHGVVFTDAVGPAAYVTKARVQLLRDLGPAAAPFNAFLVAQGLETLSLRMERHVRNARAVAEFLDAHPQVEKVNYASLPSSPWHATAQRYTPRGSGSVLAFEIAGGLEAGKRFVDALVLHSHVANIGDVRSLVVHPASTTHSQLTVEEQFSSGVTPGLVRLSVGIEAIEDVLADLALGFAAAA
ncbi:bifunctional o-acetylhomoserine/o-acetylserine sulfhydrylase [Kineococcus sp. TRM81007]|uniref:bifunctional o-acetylhomoserine/o-acetylserine sulfhydrylase n=1 Tax=Kineococcus sp. TRM81007 TaxID=2925831 RepID=UPI001F5938EE|nr:bifunctional o-acetylhomoserine/o-acetylserine sulfhydrylase [Kineococcus sp. TRM81007]MCI2239469.1 bifunctional o-acetylhomoserine/o-acetylserine sulfhydrylase [Kineococcus sp. TRM81007]